ncbi:MAG: alpha/beta hydrolase [Candidatus Lokiarchaeota archaeon]|nr:alpha/beta hydrolase [Candidatus Lokiarchaeota archaeon]
MFKSQLPQKVKIFGSIMIVLNIIMPLATLIQRLQPIVKLPTTTNIIGIISLILLIVDQGTVYFLFRQYQYKRGMKISMKSFFIVSCLVLTIQFLINFQGYSEIPIRTDMVLIFLGFLNFIPFIYAACLIYAHFYWFIPQIQQARGIKIERRMTSKLSKTNRYWLIVSISLNIILLGFGALIDYTLFFARSQGLFMLGVFAAMLSLFFGLIFLIKTFQIMSSFQQLLEASKIKTSALLITAMIGFSISSISFIPVLGTPIYIRDAERVFDTAFNPEFGGNWETQISDAAQNYFKKNHFQLVDYFIGPNNPPCVEIKDILYFNGSESNFTVDQSIMLYFDAYLPPLNYVGLPGENSTLIRIHGGGWVIGDKGSGNIGMMNRYFASQGYCVFDIQYGLNNESDLFGNIPFKPTNVMGNFTIDDMLRHIGNFTYFLEAHATEFGVNLDSVFVSGGSAGGQLTCATALSLASKNYTEFSDAYTIKGMVPFYPANNVTFDFAASSKPEWVDPVMLINMTSPPCLIFQGNQDPLIIQSKILRQKYQSFGRTDCALITFPFAGHGNDVYFPGFYNQIFLYYMERFLYLYH